MNADAVWIAVIIASCQNEWQIESCYTLVVLFSKKYMYEPGMLDNRFLLLDAINDKKKEFI